MNSGIAKFLWIMPTELYFSAALILFMHLFYN